LFWKEYRRIKTTASKNTPIMAPFTRNYTKEEDDSNIQSLEL
jgi:hypothetical protein